MGRLFCHRFVITISFTEIYLIIRTFSLTKKELNMKKVLLSLTGALALVAVLETGSLQAQTYTVGANNGSNGTTGSPCPMQDYYKQSRAQYLFLGSELAGAGMSAGEITEIAWTVTAPYVVTDADGGIIESYTIKMGTTATASLSTTLWEPGATVVWGPEDYLPSAPATVSDPAVVNTFTLDVPFMWDGVSNIFIEVCGGVSTGEWDENVQVIYSTGLAFNANRTFRSDTYSAIAGAICDYTGTVNTGPSTSRPQTIFTVVASDDCAGTPDAGMAMSTAASVCAGEPFTLSVSPVSGGGISYQWQSSADGISYSDVLGEDGPSYAVASQSEATYYQCVVSCAFGDSDVSDAVFVDQNAALDCYCEPVFTSLASGDYINIYQIGDISNLGSGEDPDNYADYTETYSTDLVRGGIYTVSTDVGPTWDEAVKTYIDFNQDGFFDESEAVGCRLVDAGTGGVTYMASIPADAPLGITRLRAIAEYNGPCDGITACMITLYGEAEDYTVNIVDGDVCPAVTGLSVDVTSSTSATISWDAAAGAEEYNVSIANLSTLEKADRTTASTSLSTTALTPGTSYQVRVRTNCGAMVSSASSAVTFSAVVRMGLNNESIVIYPNPSDGQFRIQLNGYESTNMQVIITNSIGQVVYANMMNVNDAVFVNEVDLSSLPAGSYSVRLVNDGNSIVENIIIK